MAHLGILLATIGETEVIVESDDEADRPVGRIEMPEMKMLMPQVVAIETASAKIVTAVAVAAIEETESGIVIVEQDEMVVAKMLAAALLDATVTCSMIDAVVIDEIATELSETEMTTFLHRTVEGVAQLRLPKSANPHPTLPTSFLS